MLGGLALMVVVAGNAPAQTVLYTATVTQPEADVRCKPSNESVYYATNRLHKGDKVKVVKEEDGGWLAIVPPPGSFSWINQRFLERLAKDTWTVTAHGEAPAEVLYGSAMKNEKPTVWSVKVARGTQVVSVGPALTADDGIWLPIAPPATEVRYLRAEAVARDAAPGQVPPTSVLAANDNQGGGQRNWSSVDPVPPPRADRVMPTPQTPGDPRWAEAEKAEREGRIAEAIEMYCRLGRDEANRDHDLSMRAYNQASFLRQRAAYQGVRPAEARYPYQTETRLRPVAAGASQPTATCYAPQPCCVPCGDVYPYVFQGQLRKAYQSVDWKSTYALVGLRGEVVSYVTGKDVELEPYLGRNVQLTGQAWWRGDLRANYMTASRVTPLP
jgi:hypothetical protein